MARSDLLLQLVQSGSRGDRALFRRVVEAIIAEERAKQHHSLADRLQENLSTIAHNSSNGHAKQTEARTDNFLFESHPRIGTDSLILTDTIIQFVKDFAEEFNRADILRSYGLEPRNRVLLIGPPGNGKTSLAEALACELMLPFYSVRYEGIIASYLGETSTRLNNLFEYVRSQRCVLFFDEFDSIGKERGDIHETGEIKRLVSSLLLQIDRLPSYVVVVAATNHPELLDKAVWRRFQVKLTLPKPTSKQIEQLILKFEQQANVSFGFAPNFIAQKLKGLNFSEAEDFCKLILRKYVLSIPNANLKNIVRDKLKELENSYRPKTK
jgi:SpoVK/Ycf46/Vps4 family AAA+-type ATPase